jgi:hypothetical protein
MNLHVVGNKDLTQFLAADGSWVEDYNDAEQLSLEDAVMRQVEMIRKDIVTEIFEVPLLAEGLYHAIESRVDDLQARLEAAGINLTTHVGAGDETTWTFEIPSVGLTLTMKLTGPDDFEVTTDEN